MSIGRRRRSAGPVTELSWGQDCVVSIETGNRILSYSGPESPETPRTEPRANENGRMHHDVFAMAYRHKYGWLLSPYANSPHLNAKNGAIETL